MEERSHAMPILLASSSPRRRELLAGLGLHFTIQSSRVEEEIDPHLSPGEMVERLALMKAKEVASSHPDSLVIGSDTLVVAEGKALGKPINEAEAFRMLGFLQGRVHTVYTGIALVHEASVKEQIRHSSTQVKMRSLSEAEIDDYIATGEPMDKAGSYAIQGLGATLIEWIHGDYYTVVGLPLPLLAQMLREFGIDVLKRDHVK